MKSHMENNVPMGAYNSWLNRVLYFGHVGSYCQLRADGDLPGRQNYLHPWL